MNNKVINRLIIHGRGLFLVPLIVWAMLLLPMASHAQITVVDNPALVHTTITPTSVNVTSAAPFAVSSGANLLVVVYCDRGGTGTSQPATLTWNGLTLTNLVKGNNNSSAFRDMAIYYIYNPPTGVASLITGTSGAAVSDLWLTEQTFSGVDTSVAPLSGAVAGTGSPFTSTVTGVIANSVAVVDSIVSTGPASFTITAPNGGAVSTTSDLTDGGPSGITMGNVTGLVFGTNQFIATSSTTGQRGGLIEGIFSPTSAAVILANPSPAYVWPSQTAVLTGSAIGSSTITYLWATNGVALADGTRPDGSVFSGTASNKLTIANVTANEAGSYYLTASNSLGGAISTAGVLTVLPFFAATNFTMTSFQGSGDWNSTGLWNDPYGGLPAANLAYGYSGSSFEVLPGALLRSPNVPTNYIVFPGVKLTVDGNGVFTNNPASGSAVGQIKFKETFSPTTNYYPLLVMAGGQLDNAGAGTNALGVVASTINIQGTVNIVSNTPIYVDSGGATNRGFQIDALLVGNGGIEYHDFPTASDSLYGGLNITGNANTYSGTWNVVQGPLVGSGNNSLGTNQITVGAAGILETAYAINDPNAALILNGRVFLTQNDTFLYVYVKGVPLAAGTYSAATLAGLYTNFPATFSALNGAAATTASGSITVLAVPKPSITLQPVSVTVFTNGNVQFTVTANGTLPLSYQWFTNNTLSAVSNGGNLTGATSNVLTITGVTQANAGGYTVVVTNQYGSVTSSVANLLIATPNAYESAALQNNPFVFYSFSETQNPALGNVVALDSLGNFNGTYGVASSNAFDGITGPQTAVDGLPGFPNGNTALGTVYNLANSFVTLPAFNLNRGVGTNLIGTNVLTITAWIKPQGPQVHAAGIVFSRSGTTTAGLNYNLANPDGNFNLGYTWNNDINTYSWNSTLEPTPGIWSLVALVITPTNATIYVFNANGIQVATHAYANTNQIFEGPTLIGEDSLGINRNFNGSIDDVALFGQALSANQLVTMYSGASGVFGFPPVITAQPSDERVFTNTSPTFSLGVSGYPLAYQWYKVVGAVTSAIANATNATYTTPPVLGSDNGNGYFVVISNYLGTATSSVANLSIVTPNVYEAAALTNNPFVFYTFSETDNPQSGNVTAHDSMGSFNGTYGKGGAADNSGSGAYIVAGPQTTADGLIGFPDTNTALGTIEGNFPADSYVTMPALNLNNGVGTNVLTITAWIYPNGQQLPATGIIFSRSGTTTAGLNFTSQTNSGGFSTGILTYTWNNVGATFNWNSGLTPPLNQWSLVSLVITPTNATIYVLNANGLQFSVNNVTNAPQIFEGTTLIGDDGGTALRNFTGTIDDVAFFNQALSVTNIIALYAAGSGVTFTPQPPIISVQPTWPSPVYAGQTVSATVTANGGQTYQWKAGLGGVYTNLVDGANITGSATSTLTINSVQPANALDYIVAITNAFGGVVSSPAATLTITPPGPPQIYTLDFGGAPIAQASGSDWNTVNSWNPDGLAASTTAFSNPGSTYTVVVGARLRTPSALSSFAFPGTASTLVLNGDGVYEDNALATISEIRLKHTGFNPATNSYSHLLLNGGEVNNGDTGQINFQGRIDVQANSVFYNDVAENRAFRIDSWLTGSGNIFYHDASPPNGVDDFNVTGTTNTFTGQWIVDQGVLLGSGANSLGTNNIIVGTNGLAAAVETLYNINNTNSTLILGANGQMFLHQTDQFAAVVINGTSLANGVYPFATLNSTYPTAFPATWTQQIGSTFSSGSGQIIVGNAVVGPPPTPHITHFGLSGTTMSISATNGLPGGPWALLQSTNIALPLSQWQTNITGTFDGSGNLSTNILNTVTNRQEFYLLKQ